MTTNWGITIWDARKYWKPTATAADVKAMPKSVAIDIYKQKYWKTDYYNCDTLADGVDLAVFDFGVNSGPSRAFAALKASVGGPVVDTIDKICAYRMNFLRQIGTWSHFGVGWTRRVTGIQGAAHRMAAAAAKLPIPTIPIPEPIPSEPRPPSTAPPPIWAPVPTPTGNSMPALLQLILGNPTLMALLTSLLSNPQLVAMITQVLTGLSGQVASGVPAATALQYLILTQADLDAAAAVVEAEAVKLGPPPWTLDQQREMAAKVIRSYIANVKAGK